MSSIRSIGRPVLPSNIPTSTEAVTRRPVQKTQTQTDQPTPRLRGGDTGMQAAVSRDLPGMEGIESSVYRQLLDATREDLLVTAQEHRQTPVGRALTRAAQLLEHEAGLVDILDVYRNLLQRG